MPRTLDLLGKRFGKWLVLERSGTNKYGSAIWVCKCDCGTVRRLASVYVSKKTKSCGCAGKDWCTTHGMESTKTYNVWAQMIQRCTNPNSRMYRDYGARGIRVCDSWRSSFESFLADMGEKPDGLSIDRINNNGNYEPGNCRWISQKEQLRNRRNTKFITIDGETKSLSEWCELRGINIRVVAVRLRYGWNEKAAINTPKALRSGR